MGLKRPEVLQVIKLMTILFQRRWNCKFYKSFYLLFGCLLFQLLIDYCRFWAIKLNNSINCHNFKCHVIVEHRVNYLKLQSDVQHQFWVSLGSSFLKTVYSLSMKTVIGQIHFRSTSQNIYANTFLVAECLCCLVWGNILEFVSLSWSVVLRKIDVEEWSTI